jgi:hypothetical protein
MQFSTVKAPMNTVVFKDRSATPSEFVARTIIALRDVLGTSCSGAPAANERAARVHAVRRTPAVNPEVSGVRPERSGLPCHASPASRPGRPAVPAGGGGSTRNRRAIARIDKPGNPLLREPALTLSGLPQCVKFYI